MNDVVREVLKDRRFITVGVILLVSALGIQAATKKMQLHFRKLPVPLRKALSEFDGTKMYPYKLVEKKHIPSEIEEELGTKEYVQATFEDTTLNEGALGRNVNFFTTYYTGNPDQVPHVPDVCYVGGGFNPEGSFDSHVKVQGLGVKDDRLPVRVLFFKNTRNLTPIFQTVVYFFSVNGAFVEERTKVRWHLGSIRLKYAYFSKVEMSVVSLSKPKDEDVLALSQKFLGKAVPILVQEHWQDWESFIRK